MIDLLQNSLLTCTIVAKKQRILCIQNFISLTLSHNNLETGLSLREIVTSLLGEVVLSTKEVNSRIRQAAFDALVNIGKTTTQAQDNRDPKDSFSLLTLFQIIVGGFAGASSAMLSASLLAISKLILEFREEEVFVSLCKRNESA